MLLTYGGLYILPAEDPFFDSDENVILSYTYYLNTYSTKYCDIVGLFPLNRVRTVSSEFLYKFVNNKSKLFPEFRSGDFYIVKIGKDGFSDEIF